MKTIILFLILTASAYSQNWVKLPEVITGDKGEFVNYMYYDSSSVHRYDNYIEVRIKTSDNFSSLNTEETIYLYKDRTYKENDAVKNFQTGSLMDFLYRELYP